MRPNISPDRQSPYTLEQHQQIIAAATASGIISPYRLVWHYVHSAVLRAGSLSSAAREMGLGRRTVQRIMAKKEPA